MKIKLTLQRLIRPALAVSIIASAAIVGLTDPAAARGQRDRHGAGQGYSQDAPHGKKYGNYRKHRRQQYRRHFRGHRHGNRYFRPHRHGSGHRHGYAPISFMQKTLLHKHGYRTVRSVQYRPAGNFRGHGPAYNNGAYIAIAYRPDGAYRVHLNPFSGLVIRAAFIGR